MWLHTIWSQHACLHFYSHSPSAQGDLIADFLLVSKNCVSEQSLFPRESSHPTRLKRTTHQPIIIKYFPGQQCNMPVFARLGNCCKKPFRAPGPQVQAPARSLASSTQHLENKASYPLCKTFTPWPISAAVNNVLPDPKAAKPGIICPPLTIYIQMITSACRILTASLAQIPFSLSPYHTTQAQVLYLSSQTPTQPL